jgi:hypothetical protein
MTTRRVTTMSEMSRGEMIRRLDDAFVDVRDHLANGPLSTEERHALATSLSRLLPAVADTLQAQEDADAARALRRHGPPTNTLVRDRAGSPRVRCRPRHPALWTREPCH